jgi:hypothetical protein
MSAREIYDAQQQKTEKQKRASGAGELALILLLLQPELRQTLVYQSLYICSSS